MQWICIRCWNQSTTAKNGTSACFDKNACLNWYAYELIIYRLSRAKRRSIRMVTISEAPQTRKYSLRKDWFPRSPAQSSFSFGREILLAKNFLTVVASTNHFAFSKKSVCVISVSTSDVIGQFRGPYFTVRPAKNVKVVPSRAPD